MKNILQDVIAHTFALGNVDLIKVTGTANTTTIAAIADDKSVIVNGVLKTVVPDFEGIFGMPSLGQLKTVLSFDDYDDKSKLAVHRTVRDGIDAPSSIHFETKNGDFVNDYRLMTKALVEDKVKNVSLGVTWHVEFEPTISGVMRMKKQYQANSGETTFTTKIEGGDLRVYFGDPATHSGNFVFHPMIVGSMARQWQWPVKQFLAIMDLLGDKKIRFSDQGAAEIVVDSGSAVYTYWLPAQAK
jgi:hypothetical protein